MDRKARAPRPASFDEANEEFNLWKQICTTLNKLDGIHRDGDGVFGSINKLHTVTETEGELALRQCHLGYRTTRFRQHLSNPMLGLSSSTSSKLSTLYEKAIEASNLEMKTIADTIEKLHILTALRNAPESGADQKRKKRKSEADDLRTGMVAAGGPKKAKSDRIIPNGTMVAAKHGKQKDKSEEWILAVVLNFYAEKNKYQVEDVDQDDNSGVRPIYVLSTKSVIPIPEESEVRLLPEIPPNQGVLALYPGTTCFYKATVVVSPSKVSCREVLGDDFRRNSSHAISAFPLNKDSEFLGYYKVRFEDDNNETKFVLPRDVLRVK
ncbi:SGF29 tudor-like domain-containing protein [Jimgerdemannia flammicorona]|uniref:SGF29 tudor-like domain-containing protein n=1 Tax=Jimgerdemannia flammicorona TaxID=994334 RepID=A0A433Q989_9FUNG|nr:SGF29 tudor-like domain-containing protein [Jimgerdemannia flammicorona]